MTIARFLAPLRRYTTASENMFHKRADVYLNNLVEYFEEIGDELNPPQYDVSYSSGVLTLYLDKGTYVLNKQPPNQQIWLSSPVSGPKRYEFKELMNAWVNVKDGTKIKALLDDELSEILKCKIEIPAE